MLALVLAALPLVSTPQGPQPAASAWCAGCHRDEHAQWASSRHALAATNLLYRVNHADEPMAWCTQCHAPLGLESEGVGCASCHVREGVVITSRTPSDQGLAAHAERAEPSLKTVDACAACHQFNFPVGRVEPVTMSEFPMQNTVEEWKTSGTTQTCQGCHLVRGAHAMTGGHDLQRVRGALEVDAGWISEREVRVTMRSRGVGHSVPTGDPFRSLRVDLLDDAGKVVASRRFGRTIARVANGAWRISRDLTIAPGEERSFEFEAPPTATGFRVVLVFVGEATAGQVGDASERELYRLPLTPTLSPPEGRGS